MSYRAYLNKSRTEYFKHIVLNLDSFRRIENILDEHIVDLGSFKRIENILDEHMLI